MVYEPSNTFENEWGRHQIQGVQKNPRVLPSVGRSCRAHTVIVTPSRVRSLDHRETVGFRPSVSSVFSFERVRVETRCVNKAVVQGSC